jgi:hypothetical protein
MLSIAKSLAGIAVAAVLSSPVGAQGIVLQKIKRWRWRRPSPMQRSRNAKAWDTKSR